jgi:hypothetical protein
VDYVALFPRICKLIVSSIQQAPAQMNFRMKIRQEAFGLRDFLCTKNEPTPKIWTAGAGQNYTSLVQLNVEGGRGLDAEPSFFLKKKKTYRVA